MMALLAGVKQKACDLGWRLGFGLVAFLFFVLGFGLLVFTAWLLLAEAKGVIFASWSLGLFALAIGLICLALALRKEKPAGLAEPAAPPSGAYPQSCQPQPTVTETQNLENAMQMLLNELGVPVPARAGLTSITAAALYGITLGLQSKRQTRDKKR